MASAQNRVLWWALVASIFVYGAVVAIVAPTFTDLDPQTARVAAPIMGVLSFGIGVGTYFYRRRMLVEPIQSGRLDPRTPDGARTAFSAFVVCAVLSESVAIYGLTLAFMAGDPAYFWPFAAGSLALLTLHRPTSRELVPPLSLEGRGQDATPIG